MSLTGKLILGFLFALLLQITQIIGSNVFTARLQAASEQVARALTANLTVQNGLEAVAQLRSRLARDSREPATSDTVVLRVYADELVRCAEVLQPAQPAPADTATLGIATGLAALLAQLGVVTDTVAKADPQAIADELAFLDDNAHELEQALRRCQVGMRGLAETGIASEREVRELPVHASMVIAAVGALVMAAFVAWFSPQLVKPVERARAELEDRVAERTHELATTVHELEQEMHERQRVQALKEELDQKLLEASRRAGMAELANGVLHNVGNVLNSVNVSADLLRQQLATSRTEGVARVADLLRQHTADLADFLATAQGRALPGYLEQLAQHLQRERCQLGDEVANLWARLEHMKEIVDRQQSYARCAGVTANVRAGALVEEVFTMLRASLQRHAVTAELEVIGDDDCELDRSRVVQILMNLVRNAAHAVRDAEVPDGRVRVTVARTDTRITFAVQDNGVGIATPELERIFAHGYTTRREGHGFGLHHSANAATEMGGRLSAASEGLGRGATFVLELPAPVACEAAS
ncbi:MAG: hypothetical protein K8J09_06380 [Planctomycetes bacterium]|nr:hypothetical protein [Planctomycetota bacterium]MCC7396286.1 hypothetical protein [Planctomycetota bacterium]